MNLYITIFSSILLLTLFYIMIRIEKINLGNRIFPYIDSNKVQKSLLMRLDINLFRPKKLSNENAFKILNAAEFADLFAIALTSGLNPRAGLEKIANFISQDHAELLEQALKDNSFGKTLFEALDEMTNHKSTDNLKPLMKQIFLAIDRGTPLVDVTRDFAKDQRNKLRNLITKQAAKKEIAMLMPIVFVVLPSVLAVAMYPALTVLQQLG